MYCLSDFLSIFFSFGNLFGFSVAVIFRSGMNWTSFKYILGFGVVVFLNYSALFVDPNFEYHESFYADGTPVFSILLINEVRRDKFDAEIGDLDAGLTQILFSKREHLDLVRRAARKYTGSDNDARALHLKFILEETSPNSPRLGATGWIIDASSLKEAEQIAAIVDGSLRSAYPHAKFGADSNVDESTTADNARKPVIRAVGLGTGPMIRGRLPYSSIAYGLTFYLHNKRLTSKKAETLLNMSSRNGNDPFDHITQHVRDSLTGNVVVLGPGSLDLLSFLSEDATNNFLLQAGPLGTLYKGEH